MIIINGKVIRGDDNTSKPFDEKQEILATDATRINIISHMADIRISPYDGNCVIAHLHGRVNDEKDSSLQVTKNHNEITVSVITKNNSYVISSTVICGNSSICIGSSLSLDILIPFTTFEKLNVQSENSDVNISSNVRATELCVASKNGDINVEASCEFFEIQSENGDIDVDATVHCNAVLAIETKNGDVLVHLDNIKTSDVSVTSQNGSIKNRPKLSGTYNVTGYIRSKNGDVKFK
ncbi:MAG: DUF4097 family beta strand repeat protein [Clostridia bacterium]|nr:DUF4097 family beta strand repeat protein [Clostridia bacterium]